jgi:hypothetical protein
VPYSLTSSKGVTICYVRKRERQREREGDRKKEREMGEEREKYEKQLCHFITKVGRILFPHR